MSATRDAHDRHTVGVCESLDELAQVCVAFCDTGIRTGQPVIAALRPQHAEAVRAQLAQPAAVCFVDHHQRYQHPPGALQGLRDLADRYDDHAATLPVRFVGEPSPLDGLHEDGWLRYEAAINDLLEGHLLQVLCVDERQAISPETEAELRRTHPALVERGIPQPSPDYQDPATFVATRRRAITDPLEHHPPDAALCDPSAAKARQAVEGVAHRAGLGSPIRDDLLVAASEVHANAISHGQRPVTVNGWAAAGRVVVAVHDHGDGPTGPMPGLQPSPHDDSRNGLGLWLAHQLCPEITMARTDEGFGVRLAATDEATNAASAR